MADVFISYSREDRDIADQLSKELRVRGLDVSIDKTVLVQGADFSRAIAEEIKNAKVVVVLLSANTRRSTWVERELTSAFEERSDSRSVVPVLLDAEGKHNWVWPLVANRDVIDLTDRSRGVDGIVDSIVSALPDHPSAHFRTRRGSFLARRSTILILIAVCLAILFLIIRNVRLRPNNAGMSPLPQGCKLESDSPPERLLAYRTETKQFGIEARSDVDGPINGIYTYKYLFVNLGEADVTVRWTLSGKTLIGANVTPHNCVFVEAESSNKPRIASSSQIAVRPLNGDEATIKGLAVYVGSDQ